MHGLSQTQGTPINIETCNIDLVKPCYRNARRNEEVVDAVSASIK